MVRTCDVLPLQSRRKAKTQWMLKLALFVVAFGACIFLTGCASAFNAPQVEGGPSQTQNPLVAQYSVASGCAGEAMVEFGPDTSYGRSTAWYPVTGHYQPTTILVAGMRASTTYHMRAQVQCLGITSTTADSTFTTGALPSSPPFPAIQISRPNPSLASSQAPGVELYCLIGPTSGEMLAYVTDLDGNPIWYYDVGPGNYPFPVKLLPNGHMLINIATPTSAILREVDLAGNTIREMDVATLAQKMTAAGYDFVPNLFHHDFLPLDNGHVILITNFPRSFTNLPGYPGTIQVSGDGLIDLDQNWNPVWAWNSFDYLSIDRQLPSFPDWTHSNALIYSPNDGNLILSMRNQSWVLKIDYNNGSGTGNILWHLGYQGDFALAQNGVPTDDPSVWFSFQHFPSLVSQSGPQTTLAVWDNGDNRVLNTNGTICGTPSTAGCYSRATVFQLDESAMVANLLWDDLPGYYGTWGGNINQLPNGNVEFDLNAFANPPIANVVSEVQEVTQTSTPEIIWELYVPSPTNAYRAYRIPSLYPGVAWQY